MVNLFQKLSFSIQNIIFKNLYQIAREKFVTLLEDTFSEISRAKLSISYYIHHVNMILSASKNAGIDIFKIIDAADVNKDYFLKIFSKVEHWEECGIFSLPYELIFNVVHHYQPDQLQKIVIEFLQYYIKKNNFYKLCECIQSALNITPDGFSLPENKALTDFLTKNITEAFDYPSRNIKIMARFIPDFDKLFLALMAKQAGARPLTSNHKACLGQMVIVYGYSYLQNRCVKLKYQAFSTYIGKEFSKFPELLQEADKAITTYNNLFKKSEHDLDDIKRWKFNDNLHDAIIKAAKESKGLVITINVIEICKNSGIESEMVDSKPILIIKSSRTSRSDSDDFYKKSAKPINLKKDIGAVSTMINQWGKDGLISSPTSSPTEILRANSPKKDGPSM